MEYNVFTLSNGLKIIHKPEKSPVVYCGMVVNVGSRDENTSELGMAHFVEHLLFKGTKKRSSSRIINRLEQVGGELNAFTSKEETVVYATVLSEHFELAIELLADIIFNSVFPVREIEKEKIIVLDEIQSYNDSPSELIYDEFEEVIFDAHPIGHPILGTPATLQSFQREHILSFFESHFQPHQMVFYVVGNLSNTKLERLCHKYLNVQKPSQASFQRVKPNGYVPKHTSVTKNTHQVHHMTGSQAYNLYHPCKTGFYVLNNILGGPGMNSLLNWSLREKHGLVYTVDSVYQPLTDTGLWTIYFGCDATHLVKCEKLVQGVLQKLTNELIPEKQLSRYKVQLLGQMAISAENRENLGISIGKSVLRYGKVDALSEIKSKILSVSAQNIRDMACEIFDSTQISTLTYR